MSKQNIFVLVALFLVLAGSYYWLSQSQGGFQAQKSAPKAIGSDGEIMVVCDEDLWQDSLKSVMQELFSHPFPGIYNSDQFFLVKHIPPERFEGKIKEFNLLMFIAPGDKQGKTTSMVNKAMGESVIENELSAGNYFKAISDPFAEGQLAVFFYDKTTDKLIEHLRTEKERFRVFFYERELTRMAARLNRLGINLGLDEYLKSEWNLKIIVPETHELKYKGKDLAWIHREDADKSVNLIIHRYAADSLPSVAAALAYQDSMTKIYVPGGTKGSYKIAEQRFDDKAPLFSYKEVDGKPTLVQRGLWRMENEFMGGPFVMYSVFDKETRTITCLEGFVHYPTESKRKLIRELETMMNSMVQLN